ncbi:Demethylrebeccamycin-D-glucose O-methyltransferase [Naviculisporaceae sp. PSN 640]
MDEIKSRLKASYDAIAPKYNSWTTDHSTLRNKYLDKLLGYVLPTRGTDNAVPGHDKAQATPLKGKIYRVLELGCGAGVPVTERLANFDFEKEGYGPGGAFRIVANDLSSTQVELGMGKLGESDSGYPGNRIEWIQGDMTKLNFPDESFDAVIAMYSLIHLPREEQEIMIRRIARWLKRPRGIMLLNFGDEASECEVIERWLGDDRGWMYWSAWGADKTMEIIKEENNGLEVLVDEVVSEIEEGVDVSFLWVIARRSC